jgi:hypothetical protein
MYACKYVCITYACRYAKQTQFISHHVYVFTSNILNDFTKSRFVFNGACKLI